MVRRVMTRPRRSIYLREDQLKAGQPVEA